MRTETTERDWLEARLRRPDAGENGYRGEEMGRLDALRELAALLQNGTITAEGRPGGMNTHVHTSKSFSSADAPTSRTALIFVHRPFA